jgi:hypothetical protein
MPNPTLYLYSYQEEYTSDPSELVYSYDIVFPDDVTIPANSVVDVEFKVRMALYCPNANSKICGLAILPKHDIINTPLIHALGCLSYTDTTGATDIFVPIRNVTDTDYDVTAGTCLFTCVCKQYTQFNVRIVDLDDPMME